MDKLRNSNMFREFCNKCEVFNCFLINVTNAVIHETTGEQDRNGKNLHVDCLVSFCESKKREKAEQEKIRKLFNRTLMCFCFFFTH